MPICKGENFKRRNTLLNTRGMTFFYLDWLNSNAINYICDNCGYILCFFDGGRDYVERLYNERQIGTQPLEVDYETSKAKIGRFGLFNI